MTRNRTRSTVVQLTAAILTGLLLAGPTPALAARNSAGTYSLPQGNVASGTTISSSWMNATLSDLTTEVTNSLDRTGRGAMTGPLKHTNGTAGAPSITFSNEQGSGMYRAGAGDFRFSVGGVDVGRWTGSGHWITASGSSTGRTLQDRAADVANILDFGADATGSTNSSPAINSALATGKVAQAPCGSFLLASIVSIPSGGYLRGSGTCTKFIVPDNGFVGERVITNSDISGGNTKIAISDFAVRVTADLPVTGTDPGIVRFERVDGLTVERIYTDTFYSQYTPVDLSGGNRNFVVRGCILKNTGTVSGGALWVRGGRVANAAGDSYSGVIADNVLESANDEAFGLYGWFNTISRVQVSNNVFRNTGPSALAASMVGSNLGQPGVVRDVQMTGNTIYGRVNIITGANDVVLARNMIVGPTVGTWDAVFVAQGGGAFPYNVTIENNTIRGSTRYGISAGGGANVSVVGNRISGTPQNCAYLGTYITDNVCDQTTAPAYAGIYSDDASTKVVARNKVYGGGFGGVRLLGTAASGQTLTDSNTWVDPATGYTAQRAGMLAAYKTATAQSFSTGAQTKVNFDTAVVDDRSLVTIGAGWVFAAKVAGQYRVNAQVQFTVSGATSSQEMSIQIFKGGSAVLTGTDRNAIGTSMVTLTVNGVVDLAVGDTVDARVYNDTGAARTLNPDATRNFIDITLVR